MGGKKNELSLLTCGSNLAEHVTHGADQRAVVRRNTLTFMAAARSLDIAAAAAVWVIIAHFLSMALRTMNGVYRKVTKVCPCLSN